VWPSRGLFVTTGGRARRVSADNGRDACRDGRELRRKISENRREALAQLRGTRLELTLDGRIQRPLEGREAIVEAAQADRGRVEPAQAKEDRRHVPHGLRRP
jgi:hypothetical protein